MTIELPQPRAKSTPKTLSQLVKWLLDNGHSNEIVVLVVEIYERHVNEARQPQPAPRPPKSEKLYVPRYQGLRVHFHPPEKVWWELRAVVIQRDNFTCKYCGHVGQNPWGGTRDNPADLCADHIVPLSRGGSNELTNLNCACVPCNNSKSDKLLSEWKGRLGVVNPTF